MSVEKVRNRCGFTRSRIANQDYATCFAGTPRFQFGSTPVEQKIELVLEISKVREWYEFCA
jgi:hypothetical protein